MLGCVGAGGQFAFYGRLRETHAVGHDPADGVDADVQVVLNLVEITVVLVRDLGRNVALGNTIHVLCGHIKWSDNRVQRLVHAFDDLAEIALVFRCVGAGGKFAFHRGLGQQHCVGRERSKGFHQQDHRWHEFVVIRPAAEKLELR